MKYSVYAATPEEINVGWVWIGSPKLPSRGIVKITNEQANATVFCEALQIDENFLAVYNTPGRIPIHQPDRTIVMNAWYRRLLGGVDTQSEQELKITSADTWWGRIRTCIQHPQVVVRLATWLGIISVVLGVTGVILSLL